MTDTPIPEDLTDAGDGTFFGTALAALQAGHEVQAHELDPWRTLEQGYDLPAGRYVRSRPKPVPAPPATEKVPWHEGMGRIAQAPNDGDWFTIDTVRCDYILGGPVVEGDRCTLPADDDGMVEVLVDPAPTEDDEPTDTTVIRGLTRRFDGEPQADTPAPQGRWVIDDDELIWEDENGPLDLRDINAPHAPYNSAVAARSALLDLVRRDGTAPTPDLTPLFLALKNYESAHPGVVLHGAWRKVNAAVRALRDGGTR